MKKILILGAGIFQLPLIKEAKKMGIYTIVASGDSTEIGARYCDKYYCISTIDKEKLAFVAELEKIDGVVSGASEISAPSVAFISEKLGLPGNSYEVTEIIANKRLLRSKLREEKIDSIIFKSFDSCFDAINFYREQEKSDFIIKPTLSSGSRGAFKIYSTSDIEKHFEECRSFSSEGKIIMEEFVPGIEVGGESLVIEGELKFIQATNKYKNKYFVPIGHSLPCREGHDVMEKINALLKVVVKKLNIHSCALNFDIMITDDGGPRIIELGGRLGGNCLPQLMHLYTGVNTLRIVIKMALGMRIHEYEISPVPQTQTYVGVKIINSNKEGILCDIKHADVFLPYDEIIEEVWDYKIGDKVFMFTQGRNRLGHVIFQCKNYHRLRAFIHDTEMTKVY